MSNLLENNSLRYNKNQKYICYDFETASLNTLTAGLPWQVGFLICNKQEVLESHNYYLKWPNYHISKDAERISHYDKTLVEEKGKDPIEILNIFDSYLYNPEFYSVGHNILNYDCMIHSMWRRELGLPVDYSYLKTAYDTRALITLYQLNIPWNINESSYSQQMKALSFRKRGLKSNLAFSAKLFGISVDETKTHSADFDIKLTFSIFQEMLKKFELK